MKGKIYANCSNDILIQTNEGSCVRPEYLTTGLLIHSKDAAYPSTPDEFNAGLYEVDSQPSKGYLYRSDNMRITPLNDVRKLDQTGGDVTTSDAGYSENIPAGFNPLVQTYRVNGGTCLMKQLRRYDKQLVRLMRVDKQMGCFGTEKVLARNQTDANTFQGYLAYLMVNEVLPNTTTDTYYIELNVYYALDYDNERKNANMVTIDVMSPGFIPVMLEAGTTAATARVVEQCSLKDQTAIYGNEWDATMFQNTAGANPTSVAFDADTGLLTFTPTGTYRVLNADALIAGDIDGIEGVNEFTQLAQ